MHRMANPEETEDFYSKALFAAYRELSELTEQERAIAVRKAQLQESINALGPLVFPQSVDIKTMRLPDAMRIALRSAGRPLNAHDFASRLTDLGFDLTTYSDPKASILTAMNRMVDGGEMVWVEGEKKKTVEATSDLKTVSSVPDTLGSNFAESLGSWAAAAERTETGLHGLAAFLGGEGDSK